MDITKIDKNFKMNEGAEFQSNGNAFNIPCKPFLLKGGFYDEKDGFIRMPLDYAKKVSQSVYTLSSNTAGIRVLFSTNSNIIKIKAKLPYKCVFPHMTPIASMGFTLVEVVDGEEKYVSNFIPPQEGDEMVTSCDLKGGVVRDYIFYFPLYASVSSLTFEFEDGAKIYEYDKYRKIAPILYYGSSITQGGCASKASNTYQSYLSEWLNVDYINLGFSGSAKGEQAICEYLSNIDCSVFVCDYDCNAPSVEHLKETHYKLYETFRSNPKQKNTPIIFLTRPSMFWRVDCKSFEKVIVETYKKAIANGDKNVYLIKGANYYPKEVREHCYIDGVHPNDLGFYFMAKSIYKVLKKLV